MSAHEIAAGFAWLYSTLSSDIALMSVAPGGVWRSLAEPESATPYVIMSYQAGSDSTTMNAFRLLVDALFQVKAVGPALEIASIAVAAARIDALLGCPPGAGTTQGGYIAASYRQSPLEVDELVSGELWTNMGGLYRLQIQQMPQYALRAFGSPVLY